MPMPGYQAPKGEFCEDCGDVVANLDKHECHPAKAAAYQAHEGAKHLEDELHDYLDTNEAGFFHWLGVNNRLA